LHYHSRRRGRHDGRGPLPLVRLQPVSPGSLAKLVAGAGCCVSTPGCRGQPVNRAGKLVLPRLDQAGDADRDLAEAELAVSQLAVVFRAPALHAAPAREEGAAVVAPCADGLDAAQARDRDRDGAIGAASIAELPGRVCRPSRRPFGRRAARRSSCRRRRWCSRRLHERCLSPRPAWWPGTSPCRSRRS